MPIDIGTGILHKEFQDLAIDGKFPLIWARNYSIAALRSAPTPLGRGWSSAYFCKLVYRSGAYHFLTPRGGIESFADPDRRVDRGVLVINFGAFHDLQRVGERYVVRHWDTDSGEVTHYVFGRTPPGIVSSIQAIELPRGHGLDLEYDEKSRLKAVCQRLEQRCLLVEYDAAGWIAQVIFRSADGETRPMVRYSHDSDGSLTAAADVTGLEDRYIYDGVGRLVRELVKDGGVFTMRYDRESRCVYSSAQDRYDEKRLRFIDGARTVEMTDSVGAVWRYRCLPSGQILEEINPLGGIQRTTYDEHGRISAVVNEVGATTTFGYDEAGNNSSVTNALGHVLSVSFNGARLPVRATDTADQTWEYRYDAANRLAGTTDPTGGTWAYEYDQEGNLVRLVDPIGAEKRLWFHRGTLVRGTDWRGNVSTYRFDSTGQLVERVDALGLATKFLYDEWGNLAEQHYPDGSVRRMRFDAVGNLTHLVDADGSVTSFVYGPCGVVLSIAVPDGSVSWYLWSTEPDRLSEIINERNERSLFLYDDTGNLVEEIGFDGMRQNYEYDLAGKLLALTNGSGERISYKYDALGQLVREELPDGATTSFDFDALGLISSATNKFITLKFERDPVGRLLREVQGDHWVKSLYDPAGRLVRTETDLGFAVDYTVDANGDLQRLQTRTHEGIDIVRDPRGLETRRFLFNTGYLDVRHDPVGRLTEQLLSVGNGPTDGVSLSRADFWRTYSFTARGMLNRANDSDWGERRYRYDSVDFLKEVSSPHHSLEQFDYDSAGNITTIRLGERPPTTATYEPGNRLRRAGGTLYDHDGQGRLVAQGPVIDGKILPEWRFEWNAIDQLMSITAPDQRRWSYAYDPLGRRIFKAIDGKKTVAFVWDGDRLVHEVDDGHWVAWVYGTDGFAPMLRSDERGRAQATVCDHLGTPVAFFGPDQGLERTQALSAWGRATDGERTQAERTNLRFQGQYWDSESGLHYSRFRYYSPNTGRFISQDPIGIYGGLNFYAYVPNPINFTDPFGLSTSSDSRELGNNLIRNGENPRTSGDQAAHHIVQSNSTDPRMQKLQNVLKSRGIGINDHQNGIWLPKNPSQRGSGDTRSAHGREGLHGDAYKQHVYDKLMAGAPPPPSKAQLLKRLAALKKELKQGKTFACKK